MPGRWRWPPTRPGPRSPTSTRWSATRRPDFPASAWAPAATCTTPLLPTIIAQRITAGEAVRQWAGSCHELGEPAPGRTSACSLPPTRRLAGRPAWWFHPLGIEAKRAEPLA